LGADAADGTGLGEMEGVEHVTSASAVATAKTSFIASIISIDVSSSQFSMLATARHRTTHGQRLLTLSACVDLLTTA